MRNRSCQQCASSISQAYTRQWPMPPTLPRNDQGRKKALRRQSIGGANHCLWTMACLSNALFAQSLPTPLEITSMHKVYCWIQGSILPWAAWSCPWGSAGRSAAAQPPLGLAAWPGCASAPHTASLSPAITKTRITTISKTITTTVITFDNNSNCLFKTLYPDNSPPGQLPTI